ncbi:hypothetical protein RUM44_006269 [Polyplax serrata]|uniref:protein-tyrosine-phosphatase n=1 Tax=Polyplax serrata TaxID=468196 RepID=A0ABR1AHN7_POLSC
MTGWAKNFLKLLDFYSQFTPTPLSIKHFLEFGLAACEHKSFQFLRQELPVRLSNIMKEIHLLPQNLLRMPSVRLVNEWYAQSFEEILEFEKSDVNDKVLKRFCDSLVRIRNRHCDVVQTMAQGVLELKEMHKIDQQVENSIQYFLDRFYMSRISIRMLINQHTLLFAQNIEAEKSTRSSRHVGCIDPACDLRTVIEDAYENAKFLCDQYYMASPELNIQEYGVQGHGDRIKIVYVPSHLYHMLFELFKNSMRAVMEHHGDTSDTYPPLTVTIVKGKEDVCIKMSDMGGGIPRSETEHLFKYMYSTAPKPSKSDRDTTPLAGYGYGLPISRLYARYFHGDLNLLSCDGYGTDTIICLKLLTNEANELLPIFNKTSTKFYQATIPAGDWSDQSCFITGRNTALPTKKGVNMGCNTTRISTKIEDLKQFSEALKVQKEFSCTEGEKEVNRKKNRYKDILPFNISRVVLSEYAGVAGSNYINANFIKGASGSPAYIASQGPLPNTVNDFWRMVVECEVQVIVMACNAQESGKHKCENYWVEKEGEEKRFGMVQICLVKASIVCPDFLVRTMRLKYTNDKDVTEERTVCQFHYSAWPDHGVPPLVRPLLDMVRLVRDTQASETLPVLVHCSAGCGRTGTICAIDFVWGLLRAGKLTEEFSLFNLVRDMRKQRVAMVQTKEQYILVHQAVRELFKEQLRVIESHPYENIDFNGVPLIKDSEEPFYDTICTQREENCDEKQDNSEMKEKEEESADITANKLDPAPPLPRKKRPNVLFSKQEKEAENLTAKNRASYSEKEKEKPDASLSSILVKPRIVKLRALFEKSPTVKERSALKDRGSQTVSRSHSLGAIRKPLTTEIFTEYSLGDRTKASVSSQPTPSDSGKLKYSKSFSKSVPLIKRSKSLKTFGQSTHLTVPVVPVPVDRKPSGMTPPPKTTESDTRPMNGEDRHFWKKSESCDANNRHLEISKRRRSLESLMGDLPSAITFPHNGKQHFDWPGSRKFDLADTNQGNKTTELIRQQLQLLNIEAEKRMNSFSSGLGTRERRNSFRQAVNNCDVQNVLKNYRDQAPASKKSYGIDCLPSLGSDGVRIINDMSKFAEQNNNNGVKFTDTTSEVKPTPAKQKVILNGIKCKKQESPPVLGETCYPAKSHISKQMIGRDNAGGKNLKPTGSTIDPRIQRNAIPTQSNDSTSIEEVDRSSSISKNLFLKKLNSEMLSERENENGLVKQEEPLYAHLLPHSDTRRSGALTSTDGRDELDGSRNRSIEVEIKNQITQSRSNTGYTGHQMYAKVHKASKLINDYRVYAAAPVSNSTFYNRGETSTKGMSYQNVTGQNSIGQGNLELTPDVRHKDLFLTYPHKNTVPYMTPKKISHDVENLPMGSYRRTPNPDHEVSERKLVLSPKTIISEKGNKTFDCHSWHHPTLLRSPGETISSDQKQTSRSDVLRPKSGLYEADVGPVLADLKVFKKVEPTTRIIKVRTSDSKLLKNGESSNGSNTPRRSEEHINSAVDFCNYGIVATSKLRQNPSKYSKDDFVLEEPTAPPRVKRHASVTIPRSTINNSDQWVPSESKTGADRNKTLEVVKNAWSESLGVDLDAVAASMQQGSFG